MSRPAYTDAADREIAGYSATTAVLTFTSLGLALTRHIPIAGAVMGAAFVGLWLTRRAAHRCNAEPARQHTPSSLSGRLEIRRSTGI